MLRTHRAFTLIELLVVVAIMGLLISILVPSLNESRRLSKKTACAHNLHEISVAIKAYLDVSYDTFPYAARVPTLTPTLASIPRAFQNELGRNSKVFQCPADQNTKSLALGGFTYFETEKTSYEWQADLNGVRAKLKTVPIFQGLTDVPLANVPLVYDFEAFHGGDLRRGSLNALYADLSIRSR